MKKKELSLKEITDVTNLFRIKEWPMDERNKLSLFNRFLNTYSALEREEKKLFLELSMEYDLLELREYSSLICELLIRVCEDPRLGYDTARKLYIMPLKKFADDNIIKSSTFVTYLARGRDLFYHDTLANKEICIINNYADLKNKKNIINDSRSPLILVDDFIGSGEQADNAIKDVMSEGIKKNKIVVLSLAAHRFGINRLKLLGVPLFSKIIVKRGISDSDNLKENTSIMKKIEFKIGVHENEEFGYNNAEALISLVRTPNNTFPLFWKTKKKKILPPFPRV